MTEQSRVRLCSMAQPRAVPRYPTQLFRITMKDGTTVEVRYIGISAAVAEWPDAVRWEVVETPIKNVEQIG